MNQSIYLDDVISDQSENRINVENCATYMSKALFASEIKEDKIGLVLQ